MPTHSTPTNPLASTQVNNQPFYYRANSTDSVILRQIFADKNYHLGHLPHHHNQLQQIYQGLVQQGKTPLIIDLGAHIGAASVYWANAYPQAQVIAVEPSADNLTLLRRNTGHYPAIHIHAAAIGPMPHVTLTDPGLGPWAYRTQPLASPGVDAEVATAVPTTTLAALRAQHPGTPFILKVDIEGAEADLFHNPSPCLAEFALIVVELHDWLYPGQQLSQPFLAWHAQHPERDFLLHGQHIFSVHLPA